MYSEYLAWEPLHKFAKHALIQNSYRIPNDAYRLILARTAECSASDAVAPWAKHC